MNIPAMGVFLCQQNDQTMTYNQVMTRIGDAKNAFLLVIKQRQTDTKFEMLWTLNGVAADDQELLLNSLKAAGFTSDYDKPERTEGNGYFYGYSTVKYHYQNCILQIEFITRKIKYHDSEIA